MIVDTSKILKSWLSENPNREQLDFSPESLVTVENQILDRIPSKSEFLDSKNKDFILGLLFYVGEVFKRNDRIRNLSWISRNEKMPILFCRYYKNSWVDIFQKFPSVIHRRTGRVFIDYFNKNISYFEENKERFKIDSVPIPGTKGKSYCQMLQNEDYSLQIDSIYQLLNEELYTSINTKSLYFHNESHLLIDMNSNYFFHFASTTNKKFATTHSFKCESMIEFWGDEDPNGDYMNEYLFILQLISNLPVHVYDAKDGRLHELTKPTPPSA